MQKVKGYYNFRSTDEEKWYLRIKNQALERARFTQKQRADRLEEENEKLKKENQKLKDELEKVKKQRDTYKDMVFKAHTVKAVSQTGRKRGGQVGHKGFGRKFPEQVSQIRHCFLPECPTCHGPLKRVKGLVTHTVTDVPSWQGKNHPSSHWGTPRTNDLIQQAAQIYIDSQSDLYLKNRISELPKLLDELHALDDRIPNSLPVEYPALMGINDMSLPWGGLFDINGDWAPPHNFHRWGTEADIRTSLLVEKSDNPDTAIGCPSTAPISTLILEKKAEEKAKKICKIVKEIHTRQYWLLKAVLAMKARRVVDNEGGVTTHFHVNFE